MEENGYRFGVGVLVLASAIIGVLLVAFFGAVPKFWVERYRVTVNFPSAPNVGVDTPVRKNGVVIGRVAAFSLRPGDGGVDVTLELDRKHELHFGETPRIKTGSIISGDALIEFVMPSKEMLIARFDGTAGSPRDGVLDEQETAASQALITDSSYVSQGQVAPEPIEALTEMQANLAPLFASLQRTSDRIDSVAMAVQDVVGGGSGPIRDVMNSAKSTLDNVDRTVGTINRIATQIERAEIPNAVADGLTILPELMREAQATLAQTQRTLRGFEQFSNTLETLSKDFEGIGGSVRKAMDNANVAIENLAEISEPISQNSDELVANTVRAMDDLGAVAAELRVFANRLNNSNGTIARLVDDPVMYDRVNETLSSIRNASRNIEVITQRAQPILADARIISDKLARDPGQIGVRGLLSARPVGAGVK